MPVIFDTIHDRPRRNDVIALEALDDVLHSWVIQHAAAGNDVLKEIVDKLVDAYVLEVERGPYNGDDDEAVGAATETADEMFGVQLRAWIQKHPAIGVDALQAIASELVANTISARGNQVEGDPYGSDSPW
jgi:hypothetical protein